MPAGDDEVEAEPKEKKEEEELIRLVKKDWKGGRGQSAKRVERTTHLRIITLLSIKIHPLYLTTQQSAKREMLRLKRLFHS